MMGAAFHSLVIPAGQGPAWGRAQSRTPEVATSAVLPGSRLACDGQDDRAHERALPCS